MKQAILTIFTRTPLHVGAGSSVGAIDQPVIRERHTRFPVIPGSSIKGVLRDYAAQQKIDDIERLFGHAPVNKEDKAYAGAMAFGEARLLAFPLRSAKGSFALATCPLVLARYAFAAMDLLPFDEEGNFQAPEVPAATQSDCAIAFSA